MEEQQVQPPMQVLIELRVAAGNPGYAAIAGRTAGLSSSTVGNMLTGKTAPRPSTVAAFIDGCLSYAGTRRSNRLPPEQRDRRYWQDRYDALRRPPADHDAADEEVGRYRVAVGQWFRRLALDALIPLNDPDEHPTMWLRDVFVGQDVRANPPPVDLPKDLWHRLVEAGQLGGGDLPEGLDRAVLDRLHRSYRERPRRSVLKVLAQPSALCTVLLGDPGAGKSTLIRYLALALSGNAALREELESLRGLVPLVVELRVYASPDWGTGDFLDLIAHQWDTEGFGLQRGRAEALLSRGDALVMLDGLDEVFDPKLRETIARRIAGFAARFPRARIVVTSRVVGYQRTTLDSAGFAHFKLEDLDHTQIAEFAEHWFARAFPDDQPEAERTRERLLYAIDNSRSVAELAGNPMLLTILAIIGRRHELPRDRRAVYQHAITVLVQHWDVKKHLTDNQLDEFAAALREDDKLELARRVARRMQDAEAGLAGNHIPGPELTEEFENYLRDELELPTHRARPVAEAMLEQFRHRNFILSRFGAGVYGFVHRGFLEYLAAEDIVRRFSHERELDEADLVDIYTRHWSDSAWHEVLRHTTGLLNQKFAKLAVERLLTMTPLWRQSPGAEPTHIALALQCLGEIHKLGPLAELSRAVAEAVTDVLTLAGIRERHFPGKLTRLIEQSVVPAITAFGPFWAGRAVFRRWYEQFQDILAQQAQHRESKILNLATVIAVRLAHDDPDFRRLIRDQATSAASPSLRIAAVGGLTGDDGDRETLRQLIEHDTDDDVRAAAVRALAPLSVTEPTTGAWLRALDVRRDAWAPRAAIISALAAHWPDEESLAWLQREFAQDEGDSHEVLSALGTGWGGEPGVLAWLWAEFEKNHTILVRERIVEVVAESWAQLAGVRAWLMALCAHDGIAIRENALGAIATHFRHDPDTVRVLRDNTGLALASGVRHAAVAGLCEFWAGEEADAQIEQWARHDPEETIRSTATETVAARAAGMQRQEWLRERATTDPQSWVRQSAVGALDVPDNAVWFEQHPLADTDGLVRTGAVRAILAAGAKPDLLAWLRQRTRAAPTGWERRQAVSLIAECWARTPETLSWLREQLSEPVAVTAAAEIVRGWPDEPGTTDWLQELATTSRSDELRGLAIRLLGERREPRTGATTWFRSVFGTETNPHARGEALHAGSLVDTDSAERLTWLLDTAMADGHPAPRFDALQEIADYGGRSASARSWILDRIDNEHVSRTYPVSRLLASAWLDDPATSGRLREMATGHAAPWVRSLALDTLSVLSEDRPETTAWLRERVLRDPDPDVRIAVLDRLGRALCRDDEFTAWLETVRHDDAAAPVRAHVTVMLAAAPEPLQDAFLAGTDREARRILLRPLCENWSIRPAVRAWLSELLRHDEDEVRTLALEEITTLCPATVSVDTVRTLLGDRSPAVRAEAVRALAQSYQQLPGTVEEIRAAHDPDWGVRLAAVAASRDWPPDDEQLTWLSTRAECDPEPTVRAHAILVRADAHPLDPGLPAWLRERFHTERDWQPRGAVIECLSAYGERDGIETWLRAVIGTEEDPLVLGVAVECWALGWAQRPESRAAMLALGANDPRAGVRRAVLRSVGVTRPADQEVTDWLKERLHDQDASVVASATRELTDREDIPPLELEPENR